MGVESVTFRKGQDRPVFLYEGPFCVGAEEPQDVTQTYFVSPGRADGGPPLRPLPQVEPLEHLLPTPTLQCLLWLQVPKGCMEGGRPKGVT